MIEKTPFDPDKMTTQQAADYLGIAYESLKTDRCRGQLGINFYRVGRLVYYQQRVLDAYRESRVFAHPA